MKNIEKNCLQGQKRPNKLLASMICITKKSLHRGQRNINWVYIYIAFLKFSSKNSLKCCVQ